MSVLLRSNFSINLLLTFPGARIIFISFDAVPMIFTANTVVILKDLVGELQDVTDWYYLGLCLGIPLAKLQSIKQDYRHIEERKREVLLAWSDKEKPTWVKVVNVLMDMRKMSLAQQIAQKYGKFYLVRKSW